MFKKFNMFALTLLILGQTILGPIGISTVALAEDLDKSDEATPETTSEETVEEVDKTKLQELLAASYDEEKYDETSYAAYVAAIDANEDIYEDDHATQVDVNEAVDEIQQAINALQEKKPEKDTDADENADENQTLDKIDGEEIKAEESDPTEEDAEELEEDSEEQSDEASKEEGTSEDASAEAVPEEYKAAKEAIEKALNSEEKADIEEAFNLIEAVEDEALQAELIELAESLTDLLVRPAMEVNDESFKLEIGDIIGPDGQSYGPKNPYKPGDLFELQLNWELLNGHSYEAGDYRNFNIPEELNLPNDFSGELTNDSGEVVATYEITQAGVVTLTFADFIKEYSEVKGWIKLQARVDESKVEEDDGHIVISPIGEEKEQRIPLDPSAIDKTVEKQGKPNKIYNADEIEWTVTINKNANSLKGVTLDDVLPEGTEYVDGSLKVVKQKATINGTPVGEETGISVTPSVTDGTLSIPLGDINEVYTLTYTTKVTDTEVKNFKNSITFKDDDLKDTSGAGTVTINRGEPLNKGAVKNYDPKTGIIKWYLDINFDQKDLKDVTLTDSWAASEAAGKMELVASTVKFQEMTIDEKGNATAVGEPVDPSTLGATLKKDEDGFTINGITIDKPYRVVYETKATDRHLDGFRIENTASFNGAKKGQGYNVGQYIGVKSAGEVDYDAKTIEWEIKVNQDEVSMNNVEITDTLGKGLTLIPDSLTVTHGGAEHDFTLNDEDKNPFIVDLGDISKEVVVKYKTTFDADNVPNQKPTNKANVVWKSEDGKELNKELNTSTQLNKETVDSSWKKASYNPDTKEITWTIIANYRENQYDDFNISDTPKGNQKLIEDSIRVIEMKVNADGEHSDVGPAENAKVNTDGNAFNVNLGKTDKAYKVVYKTSVADLVDLQKEYENEAQVLDGDEVIAKIDAKVAVYGEKRYGDKRGKHESGSKTVEWSIDVNIAQQTITNLQLVDKITDNQEYLEDTIKVYEANLNSDFTLSKGNELDASNYELTVEDGEFTIKWNDTVDRPYIVEYSTLFFAGEGDKVGNNYQITGDGVEDKDASSNSSAETEIGYASSGGATGTIGYLMIHKLDTTDEQDKKPLKGIQFELIDPETDKVLKTVTTDEDGYADFGRLLFGEYKLREVNIPDGYFGVEEQEITIKKPFKVGDSNPLDYKVEIENKKLKDGFEFRKVNEGSTKGLEGAEFELRKKGETTVIDTLRSGSDGTVSYGGLELGHYELKEIKAPVGYKLDDTPIEFKIEANQTEPTKVGTQGDTALSDGNIVNVKGSGASIVITKVDANDDTIFLEGAEFELYDSDNEKVGNTATTDAEGKVTFENVDYGKYTIKEVKSPEGYVSASLVDDQEILVDRPKIEVTFENEKTDRSVKLTKVRQGNADVKLSGAVFKLMKKDESGDYQEESTGHTTNDDGEINLEDLTPGKYQFVETKAPAGYILNTDPVKFEIKEDQTEQKLVMKENRRRSSGGGGGGPTPDPDPEDPKDPEKPGDPDPEDPKDPEKPGDPDPEDPKDPEKPGDPDPEDPKDPEKPGSPDPEDPNEPGKPGNQDPNKPGKPGEADPNKPGDEKPGTGSTSNDSGKEKLPQTGEELYVYMIALGVLLLATGGFVAFRRKSIK